MSLSPNFYRYINNWYFRFKMLIELLVDKSKIVYIKSKIIISKSLIQNHYSILVKSLIYKSIRYPVTHILHLFIYLKIHVIVEGNIYIIFWKVLCRRMYQHYCRCNIFYSPEKMMELSSRLKFMSWKFKTSPKV